MTEVDALRWETAPAGVHVAFTTRRGGVSQGPYASLNLGLMTEDEPARVAENRGRAVSAVGADPARAAMARQVHGPDVVEAEPVGVLRPAEHPPCDGLATGEPGQPLMLLTADCAPVALASADGPRLAVLHAGWRGVLAGIAGSGVAAVGPGARAAVGPAIGPCCYEVGEEVAAPFRERFGDDVARNGTLDLPLAVERALLAAGAGAVDRLGGCTACDPERYFSHRRDRGVTGRQGVVAVLG